MCCRSLLTEAHTFWHVPHVRAAIIRPNGRRSGVAYSTFHTPHSVDRGHAAMQSMRRSAAAVPEPFFLELVRVGEAVHAAGERAAERWRREVDPDLAGDRISRDELRSVHM